MYVCVECCTEMKCDKNEVAARYGESHVYPGDRFKCPKCGRMILATNRTPVHDPDGSVSVEYLQMKSK